MTLQERLRGKSCDQPLGREAAAELDRLQARVAELEVDAERYQWLRAKVSGHRMAGSGGKQAFAFPTHFGLPPVGDIMRGSVAQHLDAAIDTARKAKP